MSGSFYRQPGYPDPAPPTQGANTYLVPNGPLSQLPVAEVQAPQPAPPSPQASDPEPPQAELLTAWRVWHGSDWIRADDLAPTVRRMIDARERPSAVRQKLRMLAAIHPEIEAKTTGNAARPVMYYRAITADEGERLEG